MADTSEPCADAAQTQGEEQLSARVDGFLNPG
jgi:hypothetical protein